ncbi:lectin [Armillaria nabsnona]|nr:lectin [Armillaria nabsnona]
MFSKGGYLCSRHRERVCRHRCEASADAVVLRSLDARAVAPTLNFDKSFWIWTGEKPVPLGVRPFRKMVPSSSTKCPVCATIIISSDDTYSITVNGAEIGSGNGWPENKNVFAIARTNTVGDAASLIATILVDYGDGTTETIVTDNTWKALQTVPPSGWTSRNTHALVAAVFLPPAVNVKGTRDIWTNGTNAQGIAPVGHRPFRKTITSPYGKAAVCGKVFVTADDAYTLYVNGDNIGSAEDWTSMEAYSIPQLDPDVNVIAVDGANALANTPGWLAGGILIAYSDGSSERYFTDSSRKTMTSPPAEFEQATTDDSSWISSTDLGALHSGVTVPRV